MAERQRLVLDANILIRACLGIRVRQLIADSAGAVDFFVAEANAAEASGYIEVLAAWLPDTCRLRQSCDNQRCAVAWLWR